MASLPDPAHCQPAFNYKEHDSRVRGNCWEIWSKPLNETNLGMASVLDERYTLKQTGMDYNDFKERINNVY